MTTWRRAGWSIIAALAAGYLGCRCCRRPASICNPLRFNRIAQAVVQRMREQVFATAIRLPARYFDKHRSGSHLRHHQRHRGDHEPLCPGDRALVQKWCPVRHPALHGAADLRLMLVCATLLPAVGADVVLSETERARGAATRSLLSDIINSRPNESLQGMPVIQAMVQERHFANAFAG